MNLDDTNRTFGVELELLSPVSDRDLVDALNTFCQPLTWYGADDCPKNIVFRRANYSNKDNQWRVKPDVSIRSQGRGHGVEIVTPILKGEKDMEALVKLVTFLEELGCKVNKSTGFHCHIDISDFNAQNCRRLMMVLAKYETSINDFLPQSRKGNNNHYCRNSFFGGEDLYHIYKTVKRLAKISKRELLGYEPFTGRGKWNFQNFWRHGTFENRAHSGTCNADKVEHWVRLTMGLILKAKSHQVVPVHHGRLDDDRNNSKTLLAMLARSGFISSQTKRFMNKRAKDLRNAV